MAVRPRVLYQLISGGWLHSSLLGHLGRPAAGPQWSLSRSREISRVKLRASHCAQRPSRLYIRMSPFIINRSGSASAQGSWNSSRSSSHSGMIISSGSRAKLRPDDTPQGETPSRACMMSALCANVTTSFSGSEGQSGGRMDPRAGQGEVAYQLRWILECAGRRFEDLLALQEFVLCPP